MTVNTYMLMVCC